MTDSAGISRILTLVFTDLAGSTALKTQRGDQSVGELIARHRAHVRRLASESGGRIIDWAGDGCFLTFETPSAAVAFALRLQVVHDEERDLPGVRTGIHMGEVSERNGPEGDAARPRVEGLAVDLAARICALARPAQVLMSAGVAESARQRIDGQSFRKPILWRAHGSYSLKGVAAPVEIREAGLEGVASFEAPASTRRRTKVAAISALVVLAAAAAYLVRSHAPDRSSVAASGATSFAERPAIAVLPFDNLSADPEQAYFADGLAEDLITRLSAWRAFPVIARNSSFHYRGGNVDLKRVSHELGAQYVVEGSVRRAGDRIRVTAQLIDAPSDEHVWAETYDREVRDVFTLQDEISATIAASLVGDLTRAEGERARQRGTENLEAWSLYQLGLQHALRYTAEDSAEARRLFERAVALDPRFATALAQLAQSYLWDDVFGLTTASEQRVSEALATARLAVELDPRDPAARLSVGFAELQRGDLKSGLESLHRAVELNPSMPEAWFWLGWAKLLAGDPDACIADIQRAIRLSPQGPMVFLSDDPLAWAYWQMGRYEAGLEAGRRLVSARPAYPYGGVLVALNAIELGRIDEARGAIAEARRIQPSLSLELIQRILGVSRPEIDARRNAALRRAGLD